MCRRRLGSLGLGRGLILLLRIRISFFNLFCDGRWVVARAGTATGPNTQS